MLKYLFFIFTFIFSAKAVAQQYSPREISQKADNGLVVVYPTLVKDYIILKSKNPNVKIKSAAFYSILGVQVADYPVNATSTEIRLDRLQSGKYLLRYTLSDNSQKVVQIVKQ